MELPLGRVPGKVTGLLGASRVTDLLYSLGAGVAVVTVFDRGRQEAPWPGWDVLWSSCCGGTFESVRH